MQISNDSEDIKKQFLSGLKGDRAAYQTALLLLSNRIRAYVNNKLGRFHSQCDIEDVVQNILIAIHEKRWTYDTKRELMPWVFGISKYKVLQFIRSCRRRSAVITNFEVDTNHELENTIKIDQEYFENFSKTDLNLLLSRLSKEQREAVQLTKIKGLSFSEAADQAGVSLSAMKVRVHRAMKRLEQEAKEI